MHACLVHLVFGDDESRYDQFIEALAAGIPSDVTVILRGSSVTGFRWKDGAPFDSDGPGTSDLDITLVGGDMVALFEKFHILGVHSAPLSDAHPDASPSFVPLRQKLCEMLGRPVNLQATTDLVQFVRDVVMQQPYLTLIDREQRKEQEQQERQEQQDSAGETPPRA